MKEKVSRLFSKSVEQKKFSLPKFNQAADVNWILNSSELNCLLLDIPVPYLEIEKEIVQIPQKLFVNHRDTGDENNTGWKSFVLHGKSYDATREDEFYNDGRPMIWTQEGKIYCPKTVSYFQNSWPIDEFLRIRIMLLEPQGVIHVHRDSVTNSGLSAVNIAITQPIGCRFYLDNYGVIPFSPGSSFLINVSNYHTVINDSLVEKSYNKLYASTINN
jgi:hypothetical protein